MSGSAVGTILPWTGDASTIPDGWVQCNGQTLEGSEYPILASILGNTYGPTGGLNARTYDTYILGDIFRLPNLNGRVLADYEQAYVSSSAQYAHLQMGQTSQSNSVGGLSIKTGEIDSLRVSGTYTFSNLIGSASGSGLTIVVDVDVVGRAAVTTISAAGTGWVEDETVTISAASLPNGTTDMVIMVDWIKPSVQDVLLPTATGATQLIQGDGSPVSPPTSVNATSDINFNVSDSGNLTGQIRSFTVNPPSYFKTFYVVPRKLSKDHMPSHRHSNPAGVAGYRRAIPDGPAIEGFQCPDATPCCENNQKERSINAVGTGDVDFFNTDAGDPGGYGLVTRYQSGVTIVETSGPKLGTSSTAGSVGQAHSSPQPVWTGPIPRPLGATFDWTAGGSKTNYWASNLGNLTGYKNWYGYTGDGTGMIGQQTAADAVATNLFTAGDNNSSKTFPTTLNHNKEYHGTQGFHSHYTFELQMNAGFLKAPTIVPVNNIKVTSDLAGNTNTIAPQNIPSALNITVDVKTPALSMMYIIRAY